MRWVGNGCPLAPDLQAPDSCLLSPSRVLMCCCSLSAKLLCIIISTCTAVATSQAKGYCEHGMDEDYGAQAGQSPSTRLQSSLLGTSCSLPTTAAQLVRSRPVLGMIRNKTGRADAYICLFFFYWCAQYKSNHHHHYHGGHGQSPPAPPPPPPPPPPPSSSSSSCTIIQRPNFKPAVLVVGMYSYHKCC